MAALKIKEIKNSLPVPSGPPPLEWVLDYELGHALRYGREVSLILIAAPAGVDVQGLLEGLARRSDEFFPLAEGGAALLMSGTPKGGALRAVARFREACLGQFDLRFAVASYPTDGRLTGVLLQVARRRLALARAQRPQGGVCAE